MATAAMRMRAARRWPGGLAALALGGALALSLATYDAADPAINVATGRAAANALGGIGAAAADMALQALGLAALVMVAMLVGTGARLVRGLRAGWPWLRLAAATLATLAAAAALSLAAPPLHALPAGGGGAIGGGLAAALDPLWARLPADLPVAVALAATVAVLALVAASTAFAATGLPLAIPRRARIMGALRAAPDTRIALAPRTARAPAATEPRAAPPPPPAADPRRAVVAPPRADAARAREQLPLPLDTARAQLPPVSLLKPPPASSGPAVDPATLQANAADLERVLADYGVEGEITHVRPGPVVTMYELEPAPGIKASRVIGLSDDIARSMSAISARVAVVPGRTIIGIELPNARRETVSLSEMLLSDAYADTRSVLPLILGKNIAGDPVVADLAPMPHLLIAGTTGSGKSVGLNCMILSILYRLTPEQCRMILIDPKMLELSVYDGIPHLLAPVVTDPPKAIRALKWAVEQMEDRYRMMASINVRSLAGFNQRVRDARAEGKPFVRRVQTGYADDGVPLFEDQSYDFEPLPHIVVVVDELADLMMTAGKEVEFLIQRLAQKARAAGIHLIMATQRPSVDVITGVIKANLPTRISFQVTSKIDSRTILGEQGAEQLLGKGDMLYSPGGKNVARVHGPFVTDEEVERVADHWRAQGRPDYVDAVTEEPLGGADDLPLNLAFGGTAADAEADDYRRAVQVVAESRKASTSYVQRQLRIGYNNAARLIERMEKEGYVSPADHVGRREVLIDEAGNRL